jgi:hypothetical protein
MPSISSTHRVALIPLRHAGLPVISVLLQKQGEGGADFHQLIAHLQLLHLVPTVSSSSPLLPSPELGYSKGKSRHHITLPKTTCTYISKT